MRNTVQVKKASKQKIVVEETVTDTILTHKKLKRDLQVFKPIAQEFHQLFTCVVSQTANTAQNAANAQKLFLHKSVSKYKPEDELLQKWMKKLYDAPTCFTENGCVITLIQPNSRRPNRAFKNPTKPPGKHPYNDSLSYAQIVLLANGKLPLREQDEASHLCGHGRCVNPAHLLWESCSANFNRNECHHYGVECLHNPPCIPCTAHEMQHINELLDEQKQIKKQKALTKYFCGKT